MQRTVAWTGPRGQAIPGPVPARTDRRAPAAARQSPLKRIFGVMVRFSMHRDTVTIFGWW